MSGLQTDNLFIFVVEGVVLTLVSSFGVMGTLMSIYVLVQPRLRDSFSTFLTGLAICDSIFLTFAILMFGLPSLWTWYGNHIAVHIIPFSHGAIHVARMGTVYITMSVTLERFFAVVHPLKKFGAKKFLLPGTAVFSLVYNLPKFFEMETYVWPYTNETSVRQTDLRTHELYVSLYTFWSKIIFMEVIPYVTIIILNAFIVVKIVKSSRFRRNFVNQNQQQQQQYDHVPTSGVLPRNGSHTYSDNLSAHGPSSQSRARLHFGGSNESKKGSRKGSNSVELAENKKRVSSLRKSRLTSYDESQFNTHPRPRLASGSPTNSIERENSSAGVNSYSRSNSRHPSIIARLQSSTSTGSLMSAETRRQNFIKNRFDTNGTSSSISIPHAPIGGMRPRCHSSTDTHSVVTNGSTVVSHAHSQHNHPHHANLTKKHEVSLAITLVGISLLFIICQSVKIITDVYELFCEKIQSGDVVMCKSTRFIDVAVSFANLSTCINSAANFLVYMLRGKKFRDLFLETYCCKAPAYGRRGSRAANSRSVIFSIKNKFDTHHPSMAIDAPSFYLASPTQSITMLTSVNLTGHGGSPTTTLEGSHDAKTSGNKSSRPQIDNESGQTKRLFKNHSSVVEV
ncbi:uncharacterized protein LOC131889889 [Tigriopus californicus]|uniref:uncharacterized protein LOC131889889 n=1 Tax=Tigriopus californicus TaxID=6832 RepID=UPI0027D9F042|nr:uncharacterized protein LOC131889889 [Tigriopus californicus]XP_059095092.1 uncharacterized protein LOC131889889 [Tigriopus californicus]